MILRLIKRIIVSMFVLYGFNIISSNFNLMVPINIYTTSFVLLFGFPGLFALVIFRFFML